MTRKLPGPLLVGLLLLSACSERQPERYDVSGTVTFNGQPIPAGQVIFDPDWSSGNDGPQGCAEIRGGRYDTRANRKGATTGLVVVRIEGFDGQPQEDLPYGKPLFRDYRVKLELPRENSQQNFDVPASARRAARKASVPRP